jgi:hypothetical protein
MLLVLYQKSFKSIVTKGRVLQEVNDHKERCIRRKFPTCTLKSRDDLEPKVQKELCTPGVQDEHQNIVMSSGLKRHHDSPVEFKGARAFS